MGTTRTYQRILARLIELSEMPDRLGNLVAGGNGGFAVRGVSLSPGRGIAGVETSRGLLVHEAKLERDRIVRYRIVAPTEWNFHPDGALAADLTGMPADNADELRRRAALAVQSLDPCVRFTIRLQHA
jgi:coenzyme F420-reducing hydrogenase alpha subunit